MSVRELNLPTFIKCENCGGKGETTIKLQQLRGIGNIMRFCEQLNFTLLADQETLVCNSCRGTNGKELPTLELDQ